MLTPEAMIPDARKEALSEAVSQRFSCRKYQARDLEPGDWSALAYLCGKCALPGVRLIPLRCNEVLFSLPLMRVPVIRGVMTCAAVVTENDSRDALIYAGFSGELLVLELTAIHLGTCWVTGTYRKNLAEEKARPGTGCKLQGLIAVGYPDTKKSARRRKPLRSICTADPAEWAEGPRHMAELVMQAPSAMNLQPWQLALEPDRLILDAREHNPRTALDIGIALCHAELACSGTHTWHLAKSGDEPYCWAE